MLACGHRAHADVNMPRQGLPPGSPPGNMRSGSLKSSVVTAHLAVCGGCGPWAGVARPFYPGLSGTVSDNFSATQV